MYCTQTLVLAAAWPYWKVTLQYAYSAVVALYVPELTVRDELSMVAPRMTPFGRAEATLDEVQRVSRDWALIAGRAEARVADAAAAASAKARVMADEDVGRGES